MCALHDRLLITKFEESDYPLNIYWNSVRFTAQLISVHSSCSYQSSYTRCVTLSCLQLVSIVIMLVSFVESVVVLLVVYCRHLRSMQVGRKFSSIVMSFWAAYRFALIEKLVGSSFGDWRFIAECEEHSKGYGWMLPSLTSSPRDNSPKNNSVENNKIH